MVNVCNIFEAIIETMKPGTVEMEIESHARDTSKEKRGNNLALARQGRSSRERNKALVSRARLFHMYSFESE